MPKKHSISTSTPALGKDRRHLFRRVAFLRIVIGEEAARTGVVQVLE